MDFIAKAIKYHHSCRRAYIHKAESESTPEQHTSTIMHQNAFVIMKKYLVENLIEAEGAELLTSLHAIYLESLCDEYSTYPAASLRDKILREFPEQLRQCKPSNINGIIIYNACLTEETATRRASFDNHSVYETAYYLRRLVKDKEKQSEDLPERLTAEILSKGQCSSPDDLVTFFRVLYTGSLRDAPSDRVSRLIQSVCADVMFACTRGRLKPGKHLNMGLGIKSMTGSRKVMEILHHFGHSVSYHTAEELETRLAFDIANRQLSTPDGLLMQAGLATGLAWDNYDVNTETLSGGGTVHDTVGICYQNVPHTASSPIGGTGNSPSKNESSRRQKGKKQDERVFAREQKQIEPYRKKPKMSRFDYPLRQVDRPLNLTTVTWKDNLWMISMGHQPTPMWTG